ncbi:50S ribosomal protein L10 [Feifania hominis]|uniref:Large ribosomal subunit protein uL10 n=1 Tax=Feifania hominis TaxID=2763660 RepID=A0A926HTD5_9FIRM|nr:50S ribosomal protein L10 [Feifania hominis]MBC8535759.1 50S ribosomal protein L10 [Feifania hominis]
MPSAKILEQKKQAVVELTEKMKKAASGVFVDYKGITVEADTKLRAEFRKAGVEYAVVKNTLTRFATKELGYELDEVLNGTTALALCEEDPIAPAKIIHEFSSKNGDCLKVKAGFVDGKVVSVEEIDRLAKLPSRETLVAQVLYGFNSPIVGLAVVLNAIKEKLEAGEPVAASAEAPEAAAVNAEAEAPAEAE